MSLIIEQDAMATLSIGLIHMDQEIACIKAVSTAIAAPKTLALVQDVLMF
jgi:hypothetical protein